MNEPASELRTFYAGLSDEALADAYALGRDSYTEPAWNVLLREFQERSPGSTAEQPPPVESDNAPDVSVSPFWFKSRFIQRRGWDPSRNLPDLGLRVLGYLWLLVAGVVIWRGHDAWHWLPRSERSESLVGMTLVTGKYIIAACAALYFRQRWSWYFLMTMTLLVPLAQVVTSPSLPVPWFLILQLPVSLITWPLYVARRRSLFGLKPIIRLL